MGRVSRRAICAGGASPRVVQTADGFPLAHEVFEGNDAEATTVMGMVRSLAKRFPLQRVVVVADRGMISWDNLEPLQAMEISPGRVAEYLVAVPARRFRSLQHEIFTLRQELVAASRASGGEVVRERAVDGRRLVVAYSPPGGVPHGASAAPRRPGLGARSLRG